MLLLHEQIVCVFPGFQVTKISPYRTHRPNYCHLILFWFGMKSVLMNFLSGLHKKSEIIIFSILIKNYKICRHDWGRLYEVHTAWMSIWMTKRQAISTDGSDFYWCIPGVLETYKIQKKKNWNGVNAFWDNPIYPLK